MRGGTPTGSEVMTCLTQKILLCVQQDRDNDARMQHNQPKTEYIREAARA
jgi:hypothetical protein